GGPYALGDFVGAIELDVERAPEPRRDESIDVDRYALRVALRIAKTERIALDGRSADRRGGRCVGARREHQQRNGQQSSKSGSHVPRGPFASCCSIHAARGSVKRLDEGARQSILESARDALEIRPKWRRAFRACARGRRADRGSRPTDRAS